MCAQHEKGDIFLSPQTVVEGLHSVLGNAVRPAERGDTPKHAGDVHHSASGLLDEREDAQCDVDHAAQIDSYHVLVVVNSEPVIGSRRQSDSGVVYDGPQACSNTTR